MNKPNEHPLVWPQGWPRAKSRKEGQFRTGHAAVTYFAAEQRVMGELRRLHGGKVEVICSSNMIRNRQPIDPGVAVYFQAPGRPMRIRQDPQPAHGRNGCEALGPDVAQAGPDEGPKRQP